MNLKKILSTENVTELQAFLLQFLSPIDTTLDTTLDTVLATTGTTTGITEGTLDTVLATTGTTTGITEGTLDTVLATTGTTDGTLDTTNDTTNDTVDGTVDGSGMAIDITESTHDTTNDTVDDTVDGITNTDGRRVKRKRKEDRDSLLSEFLRESKDGRELFECWKLHKDSIVEYLIIDLITLVINYCKLNHLKNTIIPRTCIRDFSSVFYRNISNQKHLKSTLNLLSAIGHSIPRELHKVFNFSLKQLQVIMKPIKTRKDGKMVDDVRCLMIKFLLLFITRGDVHVKQSIIDTSLISTILKDITKDPYETVEFILFSLKRGLIDDPNLQKSLKVSFLNYNCERLVALYTCKEPFHYSPLDSKPVALLVHSFLKSTLVVHSTTLAWYKTDKINHLFAKILSLLKTNDLLQRDLFFDILSKCPELVHHFWSNAGHLSFEPRSSVFYLANVSLATAVINLPIPEKFGMTGVVNAPLVDAALSNILPPPLTKLITSKALQHTGRDVKYAAGKQLLASFGKLSKVLEYALKVRKECESEYHFTIGDLVDYRDSWEQWEKELLKKFRLGLPDFQVIIAMQKGTTTTEDSELVSMQDLSLVHIDLLRFYVVYCKDQVRESKYDFGHLFDHDLSLHPPPMITCILELLAVLPDFKWWKTTTTQPYLTQLFQLFDQSRDERHVELLLDIFKSNFGSGFLFQGYTFLHTHFWSFIKHSFPSWITFMQRILLEYHQNQFVVIDSMVDVLRVCGSGVESEMPFPPIFMLFLKGGEESVVSEFVVEFCSAGGSLKNVGAYEYVLKKYVADGGSVCGSKPVLKWLSKLSGSSDADESDMTLDSNQPDSKFVKKLLSTTNWTKLYDKFPAQRSKISFYLLLYLDTLRHSLNVEFFDVFGEELSMQFYTSLVFMEYEFFSQDTKGKCVLDRCLELIDQRVLGLKVLDEKVVVVNTFVFWVSFLVERRVSFVEPILVCIRYIVNVIENCQSGEEGKALAKIVLASNVVRSNFMSFGVDQSLLTAIARLVSVCCRYDQESSLSYKKTLIQLAKTIFASNEEDSSIDISIFNDLFFECFEILNSDEIKDLMTSILTNQHIFSNSTESLQFFIHILDTSKQEEKYVVCPDIVKKLVLCGVDCGDGTVFKLVTSEKVRFANSVDGILSPKSFVKNLCRNEFEKVLNSDVEGGLAFGCWVVKKSQQHLMWFVEWVKNHYKQLDSCQLDIVIDTLGECTLGKDGQWNSDVSADMMKVLKKLCKANLDNVIKSVENVIKGNAVCSLSKPAVDLYFVTRERAFLDHLETVFESAVGSKLQVSVDLLKLMVVLYEAIGAARLDRLLKFTVAVVHHFVKTKKSNTTNTEEEGFMTKLLVISSTAFQSASDTVNDYPLDKVFISVLKYRYTNESYLSFLTSLVPSIPTTDAQWYLEMIRTHSCYIEVMKGDRIQGKPIPKPHSAKTELLRLVYALMNVDVTRSCSREILRELMAYYHGSVDPSDIECLKIFRMYEEKAFLSVAPYLHLWGTETSATTSDTENLLEALSLIDANWMANTIHWFDSNFELEESKQTDGRIFASGLFPLYDPDFFLPLLASILCQEGRTLDPHRMLECNIVGLAVIALSSSSLAARKAGHFCVGAFYDLISTTELKEKNQVHLLLTTLKNALMASEEEKFPRLPMIISSFVAQSLMILIKPESHFYPLVNRFCLQRPILDLSDVPMFYDLFNSPSPTFKLEKSWILRLLVSGLDGAEDYKLLSRRRVVDILCGHFQSPLADYSSRKQVFQLLFKASSCPSIVSRMITKSGLLSFLKSCCTRFIWDTQDDFAFALPRLLSVLFKAYLKTPTEWDGNVDRDLWISQFEDMANLLLLQVVRLNSKVTEWTLCLIGRIVSFTKLVVQNAKNTTIHSNSLSKLVEMVPTVEQASSNFSTAPNELDSDSLFKETAHFDIGADLYDVVTITFKSSDNSRLLLNWCLKRVHANPAKLLDCVAFMIQSKGLDDWLKIEVEFWLIDVSENLHLNGSVRKLAEDLIDKLESLATKHKLINDS